MLDQAPHKAAPLHPIQIVQGDIVARIDAAPETRRAALALRRDVFRQGAQCDSDRFDPHCLHGVVSHRAASQPLVAFRVKVINRPEDLPLTYTGQFYDLTGLAKTTGPWLELGRFCQWAPAAPAESLMLAWAALGALVDRARIRALFGCTSFAQARIDRHQGALAHLRTNHLGDVSYRPRALSERAQPLPGKGADATEIPRLMRSYLSMGAWVGEDVIIDRDLDTLHVFTGLFVRDIPERRKKRLRALAKSADAP